MRKDYLADAMNEISSKYIEEAAKIKKRKISWKHWTVFAACLAVAVTALILPWQFKKINIDGTQVDTDELIDGGNEYDGDNYLVENDAQAEPIYSSGVEIGEIDKEEFVFTGVKSDACLAWMEPKEIFSMDNVIFRGTVQNIRYFEVKNGEEPFYYYRVFSVEVTDCFRGDLAKGDIYNVLADAPSSVTGMIDDLKIGDEAIFMPTTVTEETGISMNGGFFCYADLAELYLSEGYRFLFVGSNDGVQYAKDVYDITAADGEATLDDVAEYIRGMIE